MEMKQQLIALFEKTFGEQPELFFQAPGRVNLIGEHTDYNDGFVLPCAIDYQAIIAATPRDDQKVVVTAAAFDGQTTEFELALPVEPSEDATWSNYVRGVATALLERGLTLKGANMAIIGNVPQGAGLSSSACLEVCTGLALTRMSGHDISLKDLALIGQEAENKYVGVNCGIMDQMVSARGEEGHAMLLDCRSLDTRSIAIPQGAAVVIINSNKKRGLVDSEYNTRRQQCEAVAKHFDVKALRDITVEMLEARKDELDEVAYRRARHVVTEDVRTLEAAEVMPQGNLKRMGELMAASHISMRDDFEITVPEIDTIVDIVKDVIGAEGGVRMTGGGFGGCVVALAPESKVEAIRQAIDNQYKTATGLVADIYVCKASQGASVL
ncbi:galactokinase [Endozoicomonas gorgoniicola]|uniref:Galactokinase n=1 Tax=Endozoicomonas gorgoniicola TaxID=1234144 RepID=A0ABT3N2Z3_9GAMM|nr:galactokinase [Endozoicomonas gorgoniicola]MCW7555991.1 galactokinase [Endozoicomonas gorgoniicola]